MSAMDRVAGLRREIVALAGNAPLVLDDPRWMYIVEAGRVDLFVVKLENGQPVGARHHVLNLGGDRAFFGASSHPGGHGLLAVGGLGSQVGRIDIAELRRQLAQDSNGLLRMATEMLDAYMQAVAAVVAADSAAGTGLSPEQATFENLPGFQDRFLAKLTQRIQSEDEAELLRLSRKGERDEGMYRSALAGLADIIEARTGPAFQNEDALLAAMQAVGAATRVDFTHPDKFAQPATARFQVESICRASRVRSRIVALRDDWWRMDCGAILGFLAPAQKPVAGQVQEGAPVAILPVRPGVYEIFNPADRTRRPVNARSQAELSPFGYVFYRPFPDAGVRFQDVLAFVAGEVRGDVWMLAGMALATALLGLVTPWVTGKLFDTVIPNAEQGTLAQYTLGLVVAALATASFSLTQAVAVMRANSKWDGGVQAALWDRLLRLPAPFFRRYTVGDLASRAGAVNAIQQILGGGALTTILNSMHAVLNFFLLFYYNKDLAYVAAAIVAAAIVFYSLALWMSLRLRSTLTELDGKISGLVFQLLGGLSKLRVAAAERRGFAVWSRLYGRSTKLSFRANAWDNWIQVFNSAIPVISSGIIFWMVHMHLHPEKGPADPISVGDFVAFNSAFTIFLLAGISMSTTAFQVLNVIPVWKRAKPILEALPEVDSNKPASGSLTGRLDVNHLTFRYRPDGPKILDDVSFRLTPGEFVALVGPSGSGKSTILRLLLGFETPELGTIYYDGQDISKFDVSSIRRQIGVVLQNGRLLAGDIFTNIVGSLPLTMDDAWAAAEMAGVAEDIRLMPMGMFTMVSEGASTLSGGQRQRIIIARALVRRPSGIFFDEATSALDNRTQEIVTQSLDKMKATRLVIAHRLSTVRNADRIIVLEKGRIVQQGSYAELMGVPGLFRDLASRQVS